MRKRFSMILILFFLILSATSLSLFLQEVLSGEERACQHLAKGEIDQAMDILTREIQRLPQNYNLHLYLGIAYYFKKDSEKAFKEFEKIDKELDKMLTSNQPIGDEVMFLDQAMDRKGAFVFSENKKGLLYFLRGLTLKEKKDIKNAEKKFLTARKYNYDKITLCFELISLYLLSDNFKSASQELVELKKISGENQMTVFVEGCLLYKNNKVDESLAAFEKIKAVMPEAKKNIALLHYNLGNYPKALEIWEETLSLTPDDREALINAGRTLFQLGEQAKAQEYFDKASLKISPENYSPKKIPLILAPLIQETKLELPCK